MKKYLAATAICLSAAVPQKVKSQEAFFVEEPTKEQIAIHTVDLEKRISKFHPVIHQEYKNEHFRIYLNPVGRELGAWMGLYDMALECTPDYKKCRTDAFEHELGHYIGFRIPKDRKKVNDALVRHFNSPEMVDYRKVVDKLKEENVKLIPLMKGVLVAKHCNGYLNLQEFVNNAKISEEYKKSKEHFVLKKKITGCTKKNLKKSMADFVNIYNQMVKNKDNILDGKNVKLLDKLNLPYNVKKGYFIAHLSAENTIRELAKKKGTYLSKTAGTLYDLVELSQIGIMGSVDDILKWANIPPHPARLNELFAGAVDSLYDLHFGKPSVSPIKFRLNEDILSKLEQVEYRGQKIFAEQVNIYRREKVKK